MDFLKTLENYPTDLFNDSFREKIDSTVELFKVLEEYVNKPKVKCCVIGNLSSGKSTLLNALLERNILYIGRSEGTSCVARCQQSPNNEEYFTIRGRNNYLDKRLPINQVKNINRENQYYSPISMDIRNYLDIYLNISNNNLLQNLLLIDFPGFHEKNLDSISNYCNYADIIVFCFKARAGITDNDIENINIIKENIRKFQKRFRKKLINLGVLPDNKEKDRTKAKFHINFVINGCDESNSLDRNGIINKLTPHLIRDDAIFFISAKEEYQIVFHNAGVLNDARHREFERFKKCLQGQQNLALNTYRTVYLDLISSVTELTRCFDVSNNGKHQFGDKIFNDLQEKIFRLINNDKTAYYKSDIDIAMMTYSNQANRKISQSMMERFIKDHNLKNDILDDNYFYKRYIRNDDIEQPYFSWYEWGDKQDKMKANFHHHFTKNLTKIQNEIKEYYDTMAQSLLDKLRNFKNELQNIKIYINELVTGLN